MTNPTLTLDPKPNHNLHRNNALPLPPSNLLSTPRTFPTIHQSAVHNHPLPYATSLLAQHNPTRNNRPLGPLHSRGPRLPNPPCSTHTPSSFPKLRESLAALHGPRLSRDAQGTRVQQTPHRGARLFPRRDRARARDPIRAGEEERR